MRRILATARLLAAPLALSVAAAAEPQASAVVLVANSSDPGSLAIARHYAEVRQVPADNILSFPMPAGETITWREFVAGVWQPLQDELVRRHWIDGLAMSTTDAVGRRKYAMNGHHIAALVVCRGVPLRIDNDPALDGPDAAGKLSEQLRTNAGAVDSELSLLAADGGYPIEGCVPNPLYRKEHPNEWQRARVVEVSRLDGPSVPDALALVDRAVEAERGGLLGRAYIDLGGPVPEGDLWLEETGRRIASLGFDMTSDRDPATLQASVRCDAPVLYFGWHAPYLDGPFALPGFRFPPGAIAFHIYSYSAHTLRSTTESWSGPLVARGVAATVGNVYEPYLQFTHRPDLFIAALIRGAALVDAAYYALPVLSWQAILIGDPLYRPFKLPFASQLERLDRAPPELAGYALLREAGQLRSAGHPDRSIAVLEAGMVEHPNVALALELARELKAAGRLAESARVLSAAPLPPVAPADQWALECDCARLSSEEGRPDRAVEIYRRVLGIAALPRELRAHWLVDAGKAAVAAGEPRQAAEWKAELDEIVARMVEEK